MNYYIRKGFKILRHCKKSWRLRASSNGPWWCQLRMPVAKAVVQRDPRRRWRWLRREWNRASKRRSSKPSLYTLHIQPINPPISLQNILISSETGKKHNLSIISCSKENMMKMRVRYVITPYSGNCRHLSLSMIDVFLFLSLPEKLGFMLQCNEATQKFKQVWTVMYSARIDNPLWENRDNESDHCAEHFNRENVIYELEDVDLPSL